MTIPMGSPTKAPAESDLSEHWALQTLAVLAILYTAYLCRSILFPIILALVINLVLKPLVLRLSRWRIPEALGAAVILTGAVGVFAVIGVTLWNPAVSWIQSAPESFETVAHKLRPLREPIEEINEASEKVTEMTEEKGFNEPLEVTIQQPKISNTILNTSGSFLVSSLVMLVTLYFLLASGDRFLEKAVGAMPSLEEKRRVVQMARSIQKTISTYLLTVTLINIGLGVFVGLAMWFLALPNPMLWGVAAALLNYIPFAGPTIGTALVFFVALQQYDLSRALMAPTAYVFINAIEANFVTPALVGKTVSMNPLVIVLAITIGGWMWGIGGVFLAVPILMIGKVICEHSARLEPIAAFLSE